MSEGATSDHAETAAFANGEGVGERAGAASERADVVAWLNRRKANALKVGASVPEFEDEMRWVVRNIDVLIGDLTNGMHEGAAGIAAAIGEASDGR